MATSNANWLGNLINAFIFNIIAYISAFFGFFMVILGDPEFFWTTVTSFGLQPSAVEA